MNIQEHASKLNNMLTWKKFDNGVERTVTTDDHTQEIVDLTFEVNQQTSLDHDSVYDFTADALDLIANTTEASEEQLRELGDSIEADVYTGHLTDWLTKSANNVEYLTQAIKDYDASDGFEALQIAQQLAKQEVFNIVLDWLEEHKS